MTPAGGFGAIAQLVARYIRIVEARGSNPLSSTISNGIAEDGNSVSCIYSADFMADSPDWRIRYEIPFVL